MARSAFIKAMHPKSEILPEASAVKQTLDRGWIGQTKMHGHRAQIHISANPDENPLAFTRQGKRHSKPLPPAMIRELRRLFRPEKGWTAIDAEWLKDDKKLYVFDLLKSEGEVLWRLTFPERWAMLPRNFISPHITVLPLLRDLPGCLKVLEKADPKNEGLVFKSSTSTGFSDTSIVRCRRRKG